MKRFYGRITLLLFVASVVAGPVRADFQDLGVLPGGDFFESRARGISGDGNVVVGSGNIVTDIPECCFVSDEQGIRWEAGVLTSMKSLVPSHDRSLGRAANYDGSVITGNLYRGVPLWQGGFVWTTGSVVSLGDLPGGSPWSIGYGVSADGAVIAGGSVDAINDRAIRWDSGPMTNLGTGLGYSYAYAVSADGVTAVGRQESEGAKRWDGTVMSGLTPPPGDFGAVAFGISADASVIVGRSRQSSGDIAVRWDAGAPALLGTLPGDLASIAHDTSGDGSVVVGYSSDSLGNRRAFIWDAVNGMRALIDVLTANGDDMTGWTLNEATAISDDGLVIVGYGDNPGLLERGWVASFRVVAPPIPVATSPWWSRVGLTAMLLFGGVSFVRARLR